MKVLKNRFLALIAILVLMISTAPVLAEDLDHAVNPDAIPVLRCINGPSFQLSAGKTNEVELVIKNTSAYSAKSIVLQTGVSPEGMPFWIDIEEGQRNLAVISPNATKKVKFNITVDDTAEPGTYSLPLTYYFSNNYLVSFTNNDVIYFVIENAHGRPEISLSDYAVEPSVLGQGESAVLSGTIVNTGRTAMKSVQIILDGLTQEGIGLAGGVNVINLPRIDGGTHQPFSFNIVANDEMEGGNYPLNILVKYTDDADNAYENSYQAFVNVDDGKPSASKDEGKPKIIVNDYTCDPIIVMAGSEFDLGMSFLNTHSSKPVSNIKVYLTLAEETTSTTTTTGNIFTPVDSSNTFYFDSIEPKGTAHKTMRLFAVPDAQPKTYTLTVNFEYEDEDGNEYTSKELLGINVKQMTSIKTSDIFIPESWEVGMPYNIMFDIYNTGKVTLNNLMVTLEGDIDTQTKTTYIGNCQSGYTEYYDADFSILNEGENIVKVIVGYDDPSNEHIEHVYEFKVEGYAPAPMEDPMMMGGEMYPPEMDNSSGGIGSVNKTTLIIIIVVCVAAVIVIVNVVKRKKAKAEKKFLESYNDEEGNDIDESH